MALPDGVLNLQQVVRDLEKRIADLEQRLTAPTNEPAETPSAPEPAKAD